MANREAEGKLILVKHQPGIKRRQRLVFVTGVLVFAMLGYVLGNLQIQARHDRAIERLERLSEEHSALQTKEAKLRQEVANLESGRAIDDRAKQEIQQTIRDLKSSVSQLEKDVSFYQNIMAPSDNARGLQVQNVEIKPGKLPLHYEYKIVLAQVGDNKAYVSGIVAVNLIGYAGDKKLIMPLRDISEVQELGIKFRFRYFQDLTGELMLPEDFEPESLQVVAQSKGKKASRLEQSFNWKQLVATNN